MFDLVIEGGNVIDGTGAPRFRADVGVINGSIQALGDLAGENARTRVDATGLVVSPGFIDVHSHDDLFLLEKGSEPHPKVLQGVTTVVVGNCGISLAPLVTSAPPAPLNALGADTFRFKGFGEFLNAVDEAEPVLNAVALVGHSTLRVAHMSDLSRPATPCEVVAMRASLESALEHGAWGLSTGLYYPTASAASAAEVIEIGRPLSPRNALIAMHIRDEGDQIDAALREAFAIGDALDVPIVLSHHKLVGVQNHGRSIETLALVDEFSRKRSVCMDCYPYDASSTMLLPARVRQSREVLVTWSKSHPSAAGRSLFAIAKERQESPEATAAALAPAGAIYFAMSDDDVGRIMSHPLTMVGSDGLVHDAHPHPRLWGTFPRVLGRYVRDRRLFSLEEAIHKMTGLSASRFAIPNRGTIKIGNYADLVVFNPQTITDRATYKEPSLPPEGIVRVFVNGKLACENGTMTGSRAGRMLRRRS